MAFIFLFLCPKIWGLDQNQIFISNSDKYNLKIALSETVQKLKEYKNAKGYLEHLQKNVSKDVYNNLKDSLNDNLNVNEPFPICTSENLILRCGNDTLEFISSKVIIVNNAFIIDFEEINKSGLMDFLNKIYTTKRSGKLNLLEQLLINQAVADTADIATGAVGTLGALQAWSWYRGKNGAVAAGKLNLDQIKVAVANAKDVPPALKRNMIRGIQAAQEKIAAVTKVKPVAGTSTGAASLANSQPKVGVLKKVKTRLSNSTRSLRTGAGSLGSKIRGVGAGVGSTLKSGAWNLLKYGSILGLTVGALYESYNVVMSVMNPITVSCEGDDYKVCKYDRGTIGLINRNFAGNNCFILDLGEKHFEGSKISKMFSELGEVPNSQFKAATAEEECDPSITQIMETELNNKSSINEIFSDAQIRYAKRENRFQLSTTGDGRSSIDRRIQSETAVVHVLIYKKKVPLKSFYTKKLTGI